MEDIVSLAKRRGFVYQGSEIYGGLAGTYDYGPLGTLLKRNIVNEWLKFFVDGWDDMYQIDSAILMNSKVWQASGHVDTFSDPMEDGSSFNTMFKTSVGAGEDTTPVYLRPETAQGMFTNYKNILDTFSPDLPFGIAQVGKAFRNEISPRDFIFRVRELEIMEFEFFIKETDWEAKFEKWRKDMHSWFKHLGLPDGKSKRSRSRSTTGPIIPSAPSISCMISRHSTSKKSAAWLTAPTLTSKTTSSIQAKIWNTGPKMAAHRLYRMLSNRLSASTATF
jgi:glycyl-tRNA synthetase